MKELVERMLEATGLSASALGRRADVSGAAMSLILSGKRATPSFQIIQRLLQASGLGWNWLAENLAEIKINPRPEANRVGRPKWK